MKARRAMAAILLTTTAGGACSSLRPVPEPMQFINETKPPLVWVAYGTGILVEMANPEVRGDSLLGTRPGSGHLALPWNQVQSVATVQVSKGKTALLLGGLVGVAGLLTYAVIAKANAKNITCDYSDVAYEETGGPVCGPNQ
jgi:hypothetical protein